MLSSFVWVLYFYDKKHIPDSALAVHLFCQTCGRCIAHTLFNLYAKSVSHMNFTPCPNSKQLVLSDRNQSVKYALLLSNHKSISCVLDWKGNHLQMAGTCYLSIFIHFKTENTQHASNLLLEMVIYKKLSAPWQYPSSQLPPYFLVYL